MRARLQATQQVNADLRKRTPILVAAFQGDRPAPASASPDWRSRRRQLLAIEKALILCRRPGSMGPRTSKALAVAAGVCACLLLVFAGLDHLDLGDYTSAWAAANRMLYLLPYLAAAVCFWLIMGDPSTPMTWAKTLDQAVASYEPLDRDAYRRLQQRLEETRHPLEFADVMYEWLSVERRAVELAAGGARPNPLARNVRR